MIFNNEERIEEQYEKWEELCAMLTNHVVVKLDEKTQEIYNKIKRKEQLKGSDKKLYEHFILKNRDKPNLRRELYEFIKNTQEAYNEILSILNHYSPQERVEYLEWYVKEFIDEDNEDELLSKAIINMLERIKLEHNII